ncbi:MAG: hypothetical protein ACT4PT_14500 [Methanobacteriota archaeon]
MQMYVQAGRARLGLVSIVPGLASEEERVTEALKSVSPANLVVDLSLQEVMDLRRAIVYRKPWKPGRLLQTWVSLLSGRAAVAPDAGYRAAIQYAQSHDVPVHPVAAHTHVGVLDWLKIKSRARGLTATEPEALASAFEGALGDTSVGERLAAQERTIVERLTNLLVRDQLPRVTAVLAAPRARRVAEKVAERAGGTFGPAGAEWR